MTPSATATLGDGDCAHDSKHERDSAQHDGATAAELQRAAERFGDTAGIGWLETERLWELYWRGRWDDAVALAGAQLAELDAGGPRSFFEPAARLARGWISLGRNQLDVAALRRLAMLARRAARDQHHGQHRAGENGTHRELPRAAPQPAAKRHGLWHADTAQGLGKIRGTGEALLQVGRARFADDKVPLAPEFPLLGTEVIGNRRKLHAVITGAYLVEDLAQ